MVEEYNVIDNAGKSPDGRVGLMMFEARDWTDIERQITDLRKKTQAYFSYVVDGDMVKDNPLFGGRAVWFRLVCQVSPPSAAHLVFGQLHDALAKHNIEFQVALFDPNVKGSINNLISIQSPA
jgi:hypothetical protein